MERNKRDDLLVIFLGIILAYLMYLIVLSELSRTLSDYNGHTYIYLPLFKRDSWIEGWKAVPYCMWHLSVLGLNRLLHIPLETSAAYVSSLSQLFAYFVIYWMLRRFTEAKGVALGAEGPQESLSDCRWRRRCTLTGWTQETALWVHFP